MLAFASGDPIDSAGPIHGAGAINTQHYPSLYNPHPHTPQGTKRVQREGAVATVNSPTELKPWVQEETGKDRP